MVYVMNAVQACSGSGIAIRLFMDIRATTVFIVLSFEKKEVCSRRLNLSSVCKVEAVLLILEEVLR